MNSCIAAGLRGPRCLWVRKRTEGTGRAPDLKRSNGDNGGPLGARSARKGEAEIRETQARWVVNRLCFPDLGLTLQPSRRLGASGLFSVLFVSFVASFFEIRYLRLSPLSLLSSTRGKGPSGPTRAGRLLSPMWPTPVPTDPLRRIPPELLALPVEALKTSGCR